MTDAGDLTLDRILRAAGALPREVLIELAIRICEAVQANWDGAGSNLGEARDLEPGTIHVRPDGTVSAEDIGLSSPGTPAGDPNAVYRAPEGIEGHSGPRADVFVLGAIIAEMANGEALFTGRRARSGDAMTKGLDRRLKGAGIPELHDKATRGFGTVLQKCLRLDLAERWQSPGRVARELRIVQMEANVPEADLESFLLQASSATVGGPHKVDLTDDGLDLGSIEEDEHGGWAISVEEPTEKGRDIELQEATADHEVPGESGWAKAVPDLPPAGLESDAQIRERLNQVRVTSVDRTSDFKTLEEDPTFGKALKWFLKRVAIVVFLLLLLVFAVLYLGVFPGGAERQVAKAWSALPPAITDSVPTDGLVAWWAERPAQDVGKPLGTWLLGVMSEDWRRELAEEPPTPPPTPGDVTGDGIVTSVDGWIDLAENLEGEGNGRVKLSVQFGGRSRGDRVLVKAYAAAAEGDAVVVGEGAADGALVLPAAHYDLELTYREGEWTEATTGWVRGVHVHPAYESSYVVKLDADVGFLDAEIEVVAGTEEEEGDPDAEDVTRSIELRGWPEPAGETPSGEPTFTAAAGPLIGLAPGRWRVHATLTEEGRAPTTAEFRNVRVDKADLTKLRRTDLRRGEPLNPEGPGLRISATNGGKAVDEWTRVLAFPPGNKPSNGDVPSASGPAAYYFDVPRGRWDVYAVYLPNPDDPSLRAEQMLEIELAPGQIVKRTVEMGLPIAHLSAELWAGTEDLTEGLRMVVINRGAQFEAAKRLVDEEGAGWHPVEPGTYDVYLQAELEEGWRTVVYEGVEMKAGDRWKRRIERDRAEWRQQ